MPRVLIEPSGMEFEVPERCTVMAVAREQGYYWPTQCNMECRCTSCFFVVIEGADHLSPMGRAERVALLEQRGRRALKEPVRLACQAEILGDVIIRKTGIRKDES